MGNVKVFSKSHIDSDFPLVLKAKCAHFHKNRNKTVDLYKTPLWSGKSGNGGSFS